MISTYTTRLSKAFFYGALTGGVIGFFSPVLYITLAFYYFSVFSFLFLGSNFDPSLSVSSFALFSVFVGIVSILPSIIIGAIDGGLVGMTLVSWRKPNAIAAALVGFAVATILIFSCNFFFWSSTAPAHIGHATFWEFMFPAISSWDIPHFIFGKNILFVHNLLALLLSTIASAFAAAPIYKLALDEHNNIDE